MPTHLIDDLPIWAVFIFTFALVMIAFEIGLRIGNRHEVKTMKDESPISTNVSISLSLLAFVLAFVFGASAERFNDRRVLVIDEANAFNTTYQRAQFLPAATQAKIQDLLRQDVELRLNLTREFRHKDRRTAIAASIARANELQRELWAQTVAVGRSNLDSNIVSLFVESLNNTFELQSKRIAAGLYARLPDSVWIVLFVMIGLAMIGLGYQFGCTRTRNWTTVLVVASSFGLVVMMIADLERPYEGWVQTDTQSMKDEGRRMGLPVHDYTDNTNN